MPEVGVTQDRRAGSRRASGMTPRIYGIMVLVTAGTFGTLETVHQLFFSPRLFG